MTISAVSDLSISPIRDIDSNLSIGCSRVANVCGYGYKSPVEEYYIRKHASESEVNNAMLFGLLHEDSILKTFEKLCNITLYNHQELFVDKELRMHCHIDAMSADYVVDAKFTSEFNLNRKNVQGTPLYGENGSDIFPENYLFQLQGQMMLTGLSRAYLAVQFGNQDFRYYETKASPKIQNFITRKVREFWEYFDTNTPPPSDSLADVRIIYGNDIRDNEVELSLDATQTVQERQIAEYLKKLCQKVIERCSKEIEMELKDSSVGIFKDGQRIKKKGKRVYYPRTREVQSLDILKAFLERNYE